MRGFRPTLLDTATIVVALVIFASAVWVLIIGPTGPIPMHFDIQGRPDRWGDRRELALVLALMGALSLIISLSMGWFATRTPDIARRRGLRIGQALTLFSFAMVAVLVPFISLRGISGQPPIAVPTLLTGFVGLLFVVIGAIIGRVAPNPVIGVRTPWTYKSRLSWDRSNRLFGRLSFWIGLITLIAAPFAPQPAGLIVLIAATLMGAVWSVIESWRVWRTDPDRQPF